MPRMLRLSWAVFLLASCSGPSADIRSADPYERYLGVRELGAERQSHERIVKLLRDPHYLVAVGALEALADWGNPGDCLAVTFLLGAEGRDPMVRAQACITLARLGNAEAVPFLVEALKDKDAWVRREAIRALASFGARPEILKSLVDAVDDPEPSVSYMAHDQLVRLTGRTDVPRRRADWSRVFAP